jgi:hypothetical protein
MQMKHGDCQPSTKPISKSGVGLWQAVRRASAFRIAWSRINLQTFEWESSRGIAATAEMMLETHRPLLNNAMGYLPDAASQPRLFIARSDISEPEMCRP